MLRSARSFSVVLTFLRTTVGAFTDILTFLLLCFRSPSALAAENLFLRKQLGLYVERKIKPRRATNSIRLTLASLSRFFDWRNALTIVKPDTLIRWHRSGFRLFWKWKSRPRGRPRVPADVQKLIVEIAMNNPTWGEERIADELLLKIGLQISPRTIRRYMPKPPRRPADPTQRWMTFVRTIPKPSSRRIFLSLRPQRSGSSMCWSLWKWAAGKFCTSMSPAIRRRNGRSNSFENV